MIQNIKILPLLIFVAILAFSVRLSEVVTGVSELSGAAYAETKAEEKHEEPHEDPKAEKKEAIAKKQKEKKTLLITSENQKHYQKDLQDIKLSYLQYIIKQFL